MAKCSLLSVILGHSLNMRSHLVSEIPDNQQEYIDCTGELLENN